jgi:hypothetical protein
VYYDADAVNGTLRFSKVQLAIFGDLCDIHFTTKLSASSLTNIAHGSLLCYCHVSANALVVKWISHRSPEPEVRVRSPARVLSILNLLAQLRFNFLKQHRLILYRPLLLSLPYSISPGVLPTERAVRTARRIASRIASLAKWMTASGEKREVFVGSVFWAVVTAKKVSPSNEV